MKHRLLLLLLIFSALPAASQQTGNHNPSDAGVENPFYVGTNPVSFIAALQLPDAVKRYIPEVSGLEAGFSVVGGYAVTPSQILETRVAIGNIHQVARVSQVHLGGHYFPLQNSARFNSFYVGGYVKFWDYTNRLTKVHFYNLSPYAAIGYRIEFKPLLLDLRLNQTIAVHSWSSLEHSSAGTAWFFSPWPEFLAVMPSLTLTVARFL
ncbi:hypothetical protein JW992_16700 [candidate division KSB1 bacterium]|nr:hypothetical protein [candidate division KSB1 bacterium]